MSNEPKREDYPTDEAYIEAMCKHFGIPVWITKQMPADVYAKSEKIWKGIKGTSEPKVQRWECEADEFGEYDIQKNNNGNYVRYEDYVSLRAENNSLKQLNEKIMATADIIDASNQRLIEAGDEFVSLLEYEEYDMESADIKDMVDAWNAAKNLNS